MYFFNTSILYRIKLKISIVSTKKAESMAHPNYKTLLNYIENRLPQTDQAKIEEHLAHPCQQCIEKIDRLRVVLEVTRRSRTIAPPTQVLERAIDIYQKRPVTRSQPLLRVLAKLQFDSSLRPSFMPTRGGVARTRQMLFATQQVDIDLQITPERGDHNLVGQILGTQPAEKERSPAFVSLQDQTGELMEGFETDTLGQFTFKGIPAGTYDLVFDLGNQEVVITGLEFSNDQ